MDVTGTSKSAMREVVSNVEEEDEAVVEEKKRVEALVLDKLTSPCMSELEAALSEGRCVCMCARVHACMYVCMYVCIPLKVFIYYTISI